MPLTASDSELRCEGAFDPGPGALVERLAVVATVRGVKQWASTVASLGLIVAAVIALLPTSVPVTAGDGHCGPSLVRVAAQERVEDPNRQDVIDRCEARATIVVTIAGLVLLIGLLSALAIRSGERRRDAARRADAMRRRATGTRPQTSS